MCRDHKTVSKEYREGWDRAFIHTPWISTARKCLKCDRYFATASEYKFCQSCRHIIDVSAHKREHGDFDNG